MKSVKEDARKYSKAQFLRADEFSGVRYILAVVLNDGEMYTKDEAWKLSEAFKKQRVRQ